MADNPPTRGQICAIWVTHHPDPEFGLRVSRILPQVGATLIVDNGSSPGECGMLQRLGAEPGVTLIANSDNLGVARALNIGVERARSAGFAWALLFDQDTQADEDMAAQLAAVVASHPQPAQLAAVGSRYRDPTGRTNRTIRVGPRGADWEEVESVITSGCLLSLDAYRAVGPFRDEFFIDHVDTEYCLRARAGGFVVIETLRPLMAHTVGAPTAHRWFGTSTWTTNHSPDRRYYMARNNTVLLREYGARGRCAWQWKSLVRCLRLCKRIAYYEHDKLSKVRAVIEGWWDAMRGRMGPRHR